MKIKIIKILIVMTLVCSVMVVCIGCSSSLSFNVENIDVELNNDFHSEFPMQFVNQIDSVEKLESFFNNDYFGSDTTSLFKQFDDDYFEINDLLFIRYAGNEISDIEITKVKRRKNELFVTMEINIIDKDGFGPNVYRFVTIKKTETEGVDKFSYIVIH